MAKEIYELIVMRLADMDRVHPRMDSSRSCARCGAPVGIYPSGQRALQRHPGITITCNRCVDAGDADRMELAAAFEEIMQERRDSVNVKR